MHGHSRMITRMERQANPPHALRVPRNLAYLQCFAMDMAYVQYPDRGESARSIR
jgi:hypothetical protein